MCKNWFIMFMFVLLGACGMVVVPKINTYQISLKRDNVTHCESLENKPEMQITRVKANEPYDSDKMYYSLEQYQISNYTKNQWVTPVSSMLERAMQEKLLQSCEYGHVTNSDFLTASDYRLTSQLMELKQNIRGGNSSVSLIMLEQLVNNKTNKVTKSKTFYEVIETTPDQAGYVIGTNKAVDKFLNELLLWLN